jgi:hypothetical protein
LEYTVRYTFSYVLSRTGLFNEIVDVRIYFSKIMQTNKIGVFPKANTSILKFARFVHS